MKIPLPEGVHEMFVSFEHRLDTLIDLLRAILAALEESKEGRPPS